MDVRDFLQLARKLVERFVMSQGSHVEKKELHVKIISLEFALDGRDLARKCVQTRRLGVRSRMRNIDSVDLCLADPDPSHPP